MSRVFPLIMVLVMACKNKPTDSIETSFVSVSSFNLDMDTPINDERVRLLYCSSAADKNPNREYLIQFVAIRVENGDTINILSDRSDHIKEYDANRIYLLNRQRLEDLDIHYNYDDALNEIIKQNGLENVNLDIMVKSDPEFSEIENNNYKTVVGSIRKG